MEKLYFLRFITNILGIHTTYTTSSESSLTDFEQTYCFHSQLQPLYTKDSLLYLSDNTISNTVYEITDYLGTNLLLFQFQGDIFLVGPYVKTAYSEKTMQILLAEQGLPASLLLPLKLYYNKLPQLTYHMVISTIYAAMRTFLPSTPEYSYRRLYGFHEEVKKEVFMKEISQSLIQIQKSYEMENQLLKTIEAGDVDAIRSTFERLTDNFYSNQETSSRISQYTSDSIGFAVIRTLARKAAEAGGCSVITIDEITQECIQRAALANTNSEYEEVYRDLLIRLTTAVAQAKQLDLLSPVVRETYQYIQLKYSEEITLNNLADLVHVSPSYLSRTYKKEIGKSIIENITELRLEKAAEMLKSTNLNIAEIAMYVGYSDNSYFVKVFKKRYGKTPSAYR